MKKYLFLSVMALFLGCAKSPTSPINGDIYSSESVYRGSTEFPCYACIILDTQDMSSFRVSWTSTEEGEDGVDGCINKGSSFYFATSPVSFPDANTPTVSWVLEHQGSNHDSLCFPEQLSINIEYLNTGEYKLDYNTKIYRIKKR